MAWLTETPTITIRDEKSLWRVCHRCGAHSLPTEKSAPCASCGAYPRIGARERIRQIVDDGTFRELFSDIVVSDPLNFATATETYAEKAAATRKKTGLDEAVIVGTAEISGTSVVIGAMDFKFFGGSLGSATGERILRAAEVALERRFPLIIASASGGARMQEGIISLMQMARTCAAIERLKEAGLPFISLLTDPTTGGVSASFATVGDINLTEPNTLIGFAGRRVIENTIKQKLPDDFQTSEYLLEHGFVDAIVERPKMRDFIANLLSYYKPRGNAEFELPATCTASATSRACAKKAANYVWKTVQLARASSRATIRDFIDGACEDFVELHGDRAFGDDHGILGGFATIGGIKVMLIGHCKGKSVEENIRANFGMANPEGYRKAARLMQLAERWGVPVISLIDTPGAYPGADAEARGQAEAIARNLTIMATLRTPFIAVVTGEGGSGGALGIAVGDRVLMLENAIYSVISPEGCASILWRDGKAAPQAALALKITAPELLELGVIDGIIPETGVAATKDAIIENLAPLLKLSPENLVAKRYEKWKNLAKY